MNDGKAKGADQVDVIYNALLHAPCGAVVASTSATGQILYVNREFTHITGYTLDDVPTVAAWLERAYPDPAYRASVLSNWERDTSEPSRDVIYKVVCRDGASRDLLLRASLLHDERMVVTLLDVSERQRWERELSESESRFRTLTETLDQVFWIVRPEPEAILYASPAFEAIWGRTVSDLYADPGVWSECIVEEDRPAVIAQWEACLSGESPTIGVYYRIRRPDGSVRWITDIGAAVTDDEGRILRINGVAKDITGPKEAEQALRESEERYRALVGALPMGLAVHSQGVAKFANKALLEILGADTLEMVQGRSIFDFIHPDDHAMVQRRIRRIARGEQVARDEIRIARPGQSPKTVEVKGTLVEWNGDPAVQVVINDISDRKQAEERQRQLDEQLQHAQKMESLGVLAGGVAHDFNNLLVGMLGNADLALARLAPHSPLRPMLEDIELAARRAADLARQMLDYSGRGPMVVERCDLKELIQETASLMEAAVHRNVLIRYVFGGQLPVVEADPTQVRQVLMNLITNAAEAIGDRNGTIYLTTGVAHCDRAELDRAVLGEERQPGAYAFVEVRDDGCGMAPATRKRIFEPFFSTKFTGRGLGLAASLGIIKGHGGAVTVISTEGAGSTLRMLLPAVQMPPDSATVPELDPVADTVLGTVLVVDDEAVVLQVASRMLQEAGFETVVACDGREAIDCFSKRADDIDCVLLDLAMPHMDGGQVFKALRAVRNDIPVVFCSGYDKERVNERIEIVGSGGFVQKPFTSATLVSAVRDALGG